MMPTEDNYGRDGLRRSLLVLQCSEGRHRASIAARLGQVMLLVISCSGLALRAQTSGPQSVDTEGSWTTTTELQSANGSPTRTTESHTQSGNRTLDNESVQRRGADGRFEPYQDIEKETVKLNDTTARTITRAFGRDADGAKILVQVTEEVRRASPGGQSSAETSISNPDANGNLYLVRRQVEESKQISKDVVETNTVVMLPSFNGGLAPAMKVQELRTQGASGVVDSQKTTQLPDGAGKWQVSEIRQETLKQERDGRSREERISRPDSEGKLEEVFHTVSKESEGISGEKLKTSESYSPDVQGSARDGHLHLVERATISQRTSSAGRQTTEGQVEQGTAGDTGLGLQVVTVTTSTILPGPSGGQASRTVQALDATGSFGVVAVETSKSDNIHAFEVQIAPFEKTK